MKRTSIIIDSSYNVSFTFEKSQQKDLKKLPILWILNLSIFSGTPYPTSLSSHA
ncbi:hypothetical protein BACI71_70238 [Bacillus mycoides]|uniref:Uncharacterized protein n=1 Tax=Bacillus mycoides TaxID=1405 RepID=A0A654B7T8_BACMY|nr:hypothetical protein BACI71_70238 [Bacillus mycoides]